VVVLDFDRTIIDDDSDRWIVAELGLTELFKELRHSMPWISLMDRIMAQLHSNGVTVDHIADCLKRLPFPPPIVSAIKSAHALGCDLRIISDANTFSIRTILQHHALFHCFSQIHTNPAFLDNQGRLRVTPFHHSTHSPHSCPLCPPNMCKVSFLILSPFPFLSFFTTAIILVFFSILGFSDRPNSKFFIVWNWK